ADLHSKATSLLSQLDHHSQNLTWKLENLTEELVRASTKISYEIEILRSDVSGLTHEVDGISGPKIQTLRDIENKNDTIQKLRNLVKVKERMEQVQKIFIDAKEYDEKELGELVDKLIETESYQKAIEKIDNAEELCGV